MRPARPSTQTPRKLAPGCPLQVRAAHIYPLAGFPLPSLADAGAWFIFTPNISCLDRLRPSNFCSISCVYLTIDANWFKE